MLGVAFVLLGLAGLVLPLLQGILFLAIGVGLLASEVPWLERRVARLRARHPRAAQVLDRAEHWLARRWRALLGFVRGDGGPGAGVVVTLCLAEVLTMVGVFAFPAVLPTLAAAWELSSTEAGWIGGIYFAGYAAAVPLLVGITDRVDARRIYLLGAALAAASAAGFALFADGFWSALPFRLLGGVGLAGTYMPGLRVLVDRFGGPRQPRAIAFYTASFSLGTAASFLVVGELAAAFGWRIAFGAAAALAAGAVLLVWRLPAITPPPPQEPPPHLLDFRPVLRNRPAMGYVLGYAVHCWELFGMRSWQVAFLAFAAGLTLQQGQTPGLTPAGIAAASAVVAMFASILGAEAAVRWGRTQVCVAAMLLSAAASLSIGFATALPYGLLALFALMHAAFIQLDSAALTTGAVQAAEGHRRGATMALHSLLGFVAGALGPLAFGAVLDAAGGPAQPAAWGWAFASLGIVSLLGPPALLWARRGQE